MRIVAGRFRGRQIAAPRGATTRPTTDRVREATFSALASLAGADLGGGAALDAYAGTGALGLEALSRGASGVTFVERDREALRVLRGNVASLGAEADTSVICGDIATLASRGRLPRAPFALLLLDPPYRLAVAETRRVLEALAACDLLEEGAFGVWEHASGTEPNWPEGFSCVARKHYGTTEVEFAVFRGENGSS